jgi:3',5'-cyclic AMP phosphodiesterase CpdA
MAWLKADLAAVDRSRTPWLIVGMHAPWYNSNTAHQGEVEDMRRAMEALLYSYGVDLVFAGERPLKQQVSSLIVPKRFHQYISDTSVTPAGPVSACDEHLTVGGLQVMCTRMSGACACSTTSPTTAGPCT